MLYKLINKIIRVAAKKELERRVGRPLPSVHVLGNLYFETPNIEIGDDVVLWPGVSFAGTGNIKIGNGAKIGTNTIIYSSESVEIGDDTIIAALSYIIDADHNIASGRRIKDQGLRSIPIRIGSDCWVAANTVVLKGSCINNGAVIGAQSLVNGQVEKNTVVVGTPAKPIKTRE